MSTFICGHCGLAKEFIHGMCEHCFRFPTSQAPTVQHERAHHFPSEGPYHGSQEEFDDECRMLHDAY